MYIDRHPVQIFVILLIFVFAGEVGTMFVLDNFDNIGQSPWLEAIADAAKSFQAMDRGV